MPRDIATQTTGNRLRWAFLVLVFVVTMVSYADRQFLALLKPVLDKQFGWTGADYGLMTTGFQIAIALALLGAGYFMDFVGLRWGFAIGLGGWSAAAMAHAAASSVNQFLVARVALGIFEAVGTPAGMKAVTTFFPPEERTFAIGIGNMAPNLAAMVTPLVVTGLYVAVGWQMTVLLLGAFGFVCLGLWLVLPIHRMEQHRVSVAEAAQKSGPILKDRRIWALALGKLLTDQAWWFMLFWLPDFLHRRFDLNMGHLGLPVAAIYVMAGAGSLIGGFMPGALAAYGIQSARWKVMGAAAVAVLPISCILLVHSLWLTVLITGLMLAAHQAFATNIFGLAAGWFPAAHIGAAVGFAAFVGNIGGAIALHTAGILQSQGNLQPMFFAAAAGYGLAWFTIRLAAGTDRP
jgi:ACS family hexuronate transporter-like MFS transporter